MKTLIAILTLTFVLLFIGNIQAQSNEMKKINDINLRMDRYSKQNSTGNGFIIAGFLTSTIGGGIIFSNNSKETLIFGSGLLIAASALTATGIIINLNSHNRLASTKLRQVRQERKERDQKDTQLRKSKRRDGFKTIIKLIN